MYWNVEFKKSLFKKILPDEDDNLRVDLSNGFYFKDFEQILYAAIDNDPAHPKYSQICEGAFDYKGSNPCAYNIAKAFAMSQDWLSKNLGANKSSWKWGTVHHNEYPALPWSMTPLKFLFHRSVPADGNASTINVSKATSKDGILTGKFPSLLTANLKMITDTSNPDKDEYSIDTGDGMNLFADHYFDMNRDHLDGKLKPVLVGKQVDTVPNEKLIIKPGKRPSGKEDL